MKKVFVLFLFLLLVPTILAVNLEVEKQSSNEALIIGINQPASFDLKITNNGASDYFMFYTYYSPSIYPKGTTYIGAGETKDIELQIYPPLGLRKEEYVTFDYFIRGEDSSEQTENLLVKIVSLENAFEIGAGEVDPQSSSALIYIKNKVNFDFKNVEAKFSSAFFEFEDVFSLGPKEQKEFEIDLNKEDFRKLLAGYYTLETTLKAENEEAKIKSDLKFVEKNIIKTSTYSDGLIINTEKIIKTNEGNVIEDSITSIKKSIVSRLFTSFNPQPDTVIRKDFKVYYVWEQPINPGESLDITVKTNWTLPLLIIFLLVAIVVLFKTLTGRNIIVKKKIDFIKSKGGEFALKVTLFVNAKRYIENVKVIDRLPPLVKIYEKFGTEKPSKIDEKRKRIEWEFQKLEAGEKRMISYIIYSKVGIIGKFVLPSATAMFERDGKIGESESNRTFFVAEPRDEKRD